MPSPEGLSQLRLSQRHQRAAAEIARMYRLQQFIERGGDQPDCDDARKLKTIYEPWARCRQMANDVGMLSGSGHDIVINMIVDNAHYSGRRIKSLKRLSIHMGVPQSAVRKAVKTALDSYITWAGIVATQREGTTT